MGYNSRMSKKSSTPTDGKSLLQPNEKITVTVAQKSAEQSYQKHLTRLAKTLNLPGFRKGNVPARIAEEKLGRAHIIEYVLDELLPKLYSEAIKEAKKTPITHPEFRLVSADAGKDWVVEAEFAQLPTVKLTNYKALAKAGKKEAEKAKKEAQTSKKSEKSAEETKQTPEQEREHDLQFIFRELVLKIQPQVPELLLKHETQHEFEHLVGQLKQLGMTVDEYLKRRNSTMEQLSQELAVQTLNRLQLEIVLGAIAREEKLSVTDADREKYFAQIPDEKQREQLKKDAHYLGHLETSLIKQKVVDLLLTL